VEQVDAPSLGALAVGLAVFAAVCVLAIRYYRRRKGSGLMADAGTEIPSASGGRPAGTAVRGPAD